LTGLNFSAKRYFALIPICYFDINQKFELGLFNDLYALVNDVYALERKNLQLTTIKAASFVCGSHMLKTGSATCASMREDEEI